MRTGQKQNSPRSSTTLDALIYMSCTSWDFVQVITCTKSCTSYNCTKSFSNFVQVMTCTDFVLLKSLTSTTELYKLGQYIFNTFGAVQMSFCAS